MGTVVSVAPLMIIGKMARLINQMIKIYMILTKQRLLIRSVLTTFSKLTLMNIMMNKMTHISMMSMWKKRKKSRTINMIHWKLESMADHLNLFRLSLRLIHNHSKLRNQKVKRETHRAPRKSSSRSPIRWKHSISLTKTLSQSPKVIKSLHRTSKTKSKIKGTLPLLMTFMILVMEKEKVIEEYSRY